MNTATILDLITAREVAASAARDKLREHITKLFSVKFSVLSKCVVDASGEGVPLAV